MKNERNHRNNRYEKKKGRRRRKEMREEGKKRGTFGARKLKMITHLLNLYSTLLGLRRKKKGEVFRLVLLLLPLLLSPLFLSCRALKRVCHFHYTTCTYFAFPFVYSSFLSIDFPRFRVISRHIRISRKIRKNKEGHGRRHRRRAKQKCLPREKLTSTHSSVSPYH